MNEFKFWPVELLRWITIECYYQYTLVEHFKIRIWRESAKNPTHSYKMNTLVNNIHLRVMTQGVEVYKFPISISKDRSKAVMGVKCKVKYCRIRLIFQNSILFYLSFNTHDSPKSVYIWKSKLSIEFGFGIGIEGKILSQISLSDMLPFISKSLSDIAVITFGSNCF